MSTLRRGSDSQIARLDSWGRGQVRAVPGQTLPALILARGALSPDAPAVVDSALTLSHGDLRRHVKAIAAALKKAGVARGDRVAVMLGRDALLIPALLGVLDAGAAYVPLDPRFPARRLEYMAEDSGARVLLTRSDLRPGWPMTVCHVDRILADGTQPEVPTAASDLAYILYTSGSTGHPKGVAVSHRALVNLLLAMREQTGFCSSDSLLAVTTISFDIAGLELFLPLLAGGTVVICDGDTAADGRKLAARIADSGVTWMQATPTMWRMLRDAGWAGGPGLHALCGGEELPAELAAFLTPRVASLRNVYGPTETTIWSTAGSVRRFPPIDLGTPLANTEVYVADPWGRRTEPGAPGEIWIGGDGLADGYWNRPDLTTERFRTGLPCAPGERLYQTGDRGRWTGDGRLLHLGRLDTQVKLRGFRVELGEVESTLLSVAGVIEAVAVVRDDQLVAYVVTDNRDALTAASIKAAVLGTLPAYMVPSVVVILPELPLTANGKIDRNRLPDPQFRDSAAPYVEPRDAVEIGLTRIWSELLRVPRIGVHDDFFDLGGHSLLSTRVATAIRQEWSIDIAVADLLRYPTIAQLGALLRLGAGEGGAGKSSKSPLVTIRDGQPGHRPLFLFHPFGGTVFCYIAVARQFPPGRPVIAVEAPGIQHEDDSEVTVEAMAARYLEYVRGIQAHGPYALGGWCFGGVIAFEVARRLRSAGEDIEMLAAIDARAPIAANMPEIPDDWTMLSWFARDLAVPAGKKLQIPAEELRGLGGQAGFDRVLVGATAIGVLAEDADRATLRRYFEVYLANGIALQTYLPQASDLDMLVLRAKDETEDYGPSLGWDSLIRGSLDVEQVPGDHNSVMYPQHAPAVAAAMAQRYRKGAGR
jgi:amino acid adenylation domain-containing protein